MKNKVLVTSPSHLVSRELIKALEIANVEVHAPELDLDWLEKINEAMAGAYSVFLNIPMNPKMVKQGQNVVEAAKKQNVKFILASSIINAHTTSQDRLFRDHGQIDALVRESGITYCITHPNICMQKFVDRYTDAINNTGEIVGTQKPEASTSYIDARDIAQVDARILDVPQRHRNVEYTLTGPDRMSNEEVAKAFSEVCNRTIVYNPITDKQFIHDQRKKAVDDWYTEALLAIDSLTNSGLMSVITRDVFQITVQPLVSFHRFLRDYSHLWKGLPVPRVGMQDE